MRVESTFAAAGYADQWSAKICSKLAAGAELAWSKVHDRGALVTPCSDQGAPVGDPRLEPRVRDQAP